MEWGDDAREFFARLHYNVAEETILRVFPRTLEGICKNNSGRIQPVQRRMVGILLNDQLETIWKEAAVAYVRY
jgi:hypothetical protein